MYKINQILIFCFLVGEISSKNTTARFSTIESKSFQSRQNRLISFNTLDNGDINMELAFNVPFITIPVKKSLDFAHGAIANINIGAVILAGGIIFGFAVLIPGIVLAMSTKTGYRSDDAPPWWRLLTAVEQNLSQRDIDSTSCVQKVLCRLVQKARENNTAGRGSSNDKIIEGLATHKWLQGFLQGTVIEDALRSGLQNENCSRFVQCKVNEKNIAMFADLFQ